MVYKFFDKNTADVAIKNENMSHKELSKEVHKSIIRRFEKRKVHSPSIDNIWSLDLADIQLISKFNIEEFVFYYTLLIFSVNRHGLFL